MEAFATGWEDLPELIPGRSGYRVLIGPGRLVPAYSVEAQLAPSGVIELLRLDLQMTWPDARQDDDWAPRGARASADALPLPRHRSIGAPEPEADPFGPADDDDDHDHTAATAGGMAWTTPETCERPIGSPGGVAQR
jgi:hypothetical protein